MRGNKKTALRRPSIDTSSNLSEAEMEPSSSQAFSARSPKEPQAIENNMKIRMRFYRESPSARIFGATCHQFSKCE